MEDAGSMDIDAGLMATGAGLTDIEGAGGDSVVIPALVGFGATLAGIYSVGRAYDNVRFWNDYYKKTGFKSKYPFIRGSYDFMNSGASAFKNLKRF